MLIALAFAPMATDTPTLAIVLGFIGTVITGILGAIVTISMNRNEKRQTAENALEKAYEQRLALRNEKLAELEQDLKEVREERDAIAAERDKAVQQRDRLYLAIVEQRAEEKVRNDDS